MPITYALAHWRRLGAERQPRAQLLLLAFPVLAWLAVRAAFGEAVVGGTYAFGNPAAALRNSYKTALHWPFWTRKAPWHLQPAFSLDFLGSLVMAALNLLSLATVFGILAYRLASRSALRMDEAGFLASYAFILLVGTIARYGCVQVFLVLCLARWACARPRLVPALAAAYAAALVLAALPAWRAFPGDRALQSAYQALAPDYVKLLKSYGPDERVIVLNDPVTLFATTSTLNRVLGVRAHVDKLADFACRAASRTSTLTVP